MKKLFLIIPILFFLSIKELKVISYNIRYNNPNDGINIWDNRKSTITKFLIDESPDFAGLQEVTYSQLSFLKDSLVNYSFIGVGRDDGKTKGEYSPIFYNKKKYKVLSKLNKKLDYNLVVFLVEHKNNKNLYKSVLKQKIEYYDPFGFYT